MDLNPALGVNLRDYDPNDILAEKLWRVTEKVDGVRRLFYKDKQGQVFAYSRSGKADIWLDHITSYLGTSNFPTDMIYDCELVDSSLYFSNEDSFLLRSKTIGLASQQYSDNKKDLIAICFDMFMPDGDLTNGFGRDAILQKAFYNVPLHAPIFMVTHYGILNGNDVKLLSHLMGNMIAQNKEGLMLMDMEAPYIHGRSTTLVKVKRIEEFLGTVIDVEYADKGTKIDGGISALICEVPGCTVSVRVGSGFTNEERVYFVNESPIGQTIELEAFGKTKSKKGHISLSMPIFKRMIPTYRHTNNDDPLFKL